MVHVKHSGSRCASIRRTGSRNLLISLGFSRSLASACRKCSSKNTKSLAAVSSEPELHSPRRRIGARRHDTFSPKLSENPSEHHTRSAASTGATGSRGRDRRAVFPAQQHGLLPPTQTAAAFQPPHATAPAKDRVAGARWASAFPSPQPAPRLLLKATQ